jgi:hypothetical protein
MRLEPFLNPVHGQFQQNPAPENFKEHRKARSTSITRAPFVQVDPAYSDALPSARGFMAIVTAM